MQSVCFNETITTNDACMARTGLVQYSNNAVCRHVSHTHTTHPHVHLVDRSESSELNWWWLKFPWSPCQCHCHCHTHTHTHLVGEMFISWVEVMFPKKKKDWVEDASATQLCNARLPPLAAFSSSSTPVNNFFFLVEPVNKYSPACDACTGSHSIGPGRTGTLFSLTGYWVLARPLEDHWIVCVFAYLLGYRSICI
jgi:hypothetical protein